MDYLSIGRIIVYCVAYPIYYILSLILYTLAVVTTPLQYLVRYLAYACWYPIHILAKFETLYIFFGVAILIGVLTGIGVHYVSGFAISVLSLESHMSEQRGRTLTSYRAEKQSRLEQGNPLMELKQQNGLLVDNGGLNGEYVEWERPKKDRGRAGSRLVPNIILEEDSTEDDF